MAGKDKPTKKRYPSIRKQNPNATPEMVARALLRRVRPFEKRKTGK